MYWICLSKEELELIIGTLEGYYCDGVGNDEEQAEWEKMQELVRKLDFIQRTEQAK